MATDAGRPGTDDYHALISLHHGLRLGRHLRGGAGEPTARAAVPVWPQLPEDREALRESLLMIEPLPDALLSMYGALFRDRPHLRGLFPGSILAQRERLSRYLRWLIGSLDDPQSVVPVLENLGREHRKLGVLAQHYTGFAGALAEALRQAGGDRWTERYDRAWLRLYWFIAKVMMDASEQVTADPPYVTATVTGHELRRDDLAVIHLRTSEAYRYQAGQHATLESPRLPRAWRCYSLATAPGDGRSLEFHVRAKGAGGLSDVLVEQTSIGDRLRVGPARGDLRASAIDGTDLLLVAGGTGLAPIRAILGDLTRRCAPPRTTLFVGARTRADLYGLDLLAADTVRSPWLRLIPAVSRGPAAPFESGDLPGIVARYGPWTGCRAALAGPPELIGVMLPLLTELGVPDEQILFDPE